VSEPLLAVLRLCLIALLYLFFLRVLRAVWTEIRGPRPAPVGAASGTTPGPTRGSRREERSGAARLQIVEPSALRGRAFELGDELTIGRAAGCQITLDDTFVSQIHARVFRRDDHFLIEDLGSTNGTYLNRQKVTGPMMVRLRDQIQVGNTVLELA
jgi:pSer/pThr/pTyr-binding forkhead associated (FHA) protein